VKLGVTGFLIMIFAPFLFGGLSASAGQAGVGLGVAGSFAVLAGTTVTNTGPTLIQGNLGVSPGSAVTGFPPGIVTNGTTHAGDANAAQAQLDLTTAYDDAAGRNASQVITSDLGGLTLGPGVYRASSAISLNGTLTLHGQTDSDSVFIFQAVSTLITASNSSVRLIGGAKACNVFWQVGSSATLGTGTDFVGSILAYSSVSVQTGATVDGRVLARHAQVSLEANRVKRATCEASATTTSTASTTTTTSASTTTTAPTTTTTEAPTTTTTAPSTSSTTGSSTTTTTLQSTSTTQSPPFGSTTTTAPAVTTTTMTGIVSATTTTTRDSDVGAPPSDTYDDLPKTGSPIGTSLLVAIIALVAGAVVARCGNRSSP
jgi:hypothetical protein